MRVRRKARPAARTRRGAHVVEFAVVAPVMFLLTFGIIEFGRLMMVQQATTTAARVACREASLATTINSSDVDTAARNVMLGVMANASNASKVRVSMTPASMASVASGTPVNVYLEVNFSDVSWIPGTLLDIAGTRVISAEATFDRE
jgi:Flp pilus assembly protein TadG